MYINSISTNQQSFKALDISGSVYRYPKLLNTLKTSPEIKTFVDTLHNDGYDVLADVFKYEDYKSNTEWLNKIGFYLQAKKKVLSEESFVYRLKRIVFWDDFESGIENFNAKKALKKISLKRLG